MDRSVRRLRVSRSLRAIVPIVQVRKGLSVRRHRVALAPVTVYGEKKWEAGYLERTTIALKVALFPRMYSRMRTVATSQASAQTYL